MSDWQHIRCVGGHDRCNQMYPSPECPYCERIPRRRKEIDAERLDREERERAAAWRDPRQTSLLQ